MKKYGRQTFIWVYYFLPLKALGGLFKSHVWAEKMCPIAMDGCFIYRDLGEVGLGSFGKPLLGGNPGPSYLSHTWDSRWHQHCLGGNLWWLFILKRNKLHWFWCCMDLFWVYRIFISNARNMCILETIRNCRKKTGTFSHTSFCSSFDISVYSLWFMCSS